MHNKSVWLKSCVYGVSSVFLFLSVNASAESCTQGNAPQQIACLKIQNAILGERLARATLLKNISKQSKKTKTSRNLGLPDVLSTYGIGDRLSAVLVWTHDGKNIGRMITHVGSVLPDGWIVSKIKDGNVSIKKGGRIETLLLDSENSHQQIHLNTLLSNHSANGSSIGPVKFSPIKTMTP